MARKYVDLRALPAWAQYAIAIATAALVSTLAWHVALHRGGVVSVQPRTVSLLGWLGVGLVVVVIATRHRRRR